MKSWSWILLIVLVILIKFASTQPLWVEDNYSTIIYPVSARLQRAMFGWMPFSLGDIIYTLLVLVILVKTFNLFKTIIRKQFNRQYLLSGLKQVIFFILLIYVLFYGLWGLNYSRKGISYQLGLDVKEFSQQDLDTLINKLQGRLNHYAREIDTAARTNNLKAENLFLKGEDAYLSAQRNFSFLRYSPRSIKKSLYTPINHLFGVTGYYNPFTGEAQVNMSIPRFLHPIITTHEIAHQLGYGKENEANFVAFLACRSYDDADFRYSMYFDMYLYAVREMTRFDIDTARSYRHDLDTIVRIDYRRWLNYLMSRSNVMEPVVSRVYDSYLRANNQPLGKETYNQVVAWLIAYYKKNGLESL